jgi:hypothetical protein
VAFLGIFIDRYGMGNDGISDGAFALCAFFVVLLSDTLTAYVNAVFLPRLRL